MEREHIEVRGAYVNNLQHIDVDIPLHALVAITGRSGSGKSSLAMGVLYAEGMRRYMSALSTYTRRRLSQTTPAAVEAVHHIPSAIALRQRPTIPGVRSTVGTTTEALNVIRLMFSRLGSLVCPNGHRIPPTLDIARAMDRPNDGKSDMGGITCPTCGVHFTAFSAEDFAFNANGACPTCGGTGQAKTLASERLIPDPSLTIRQGAVASWRLPGRNFMPFVAQALGIDIDTPFEALDAAQQDLVWHGDKKQYAINIPTKTGRVFHMDHALYENAYRAVTDSMATATNERTIARLDRFYTFGTCPTCHGSRFDPKLLSQTLNGKNIAQVSDLTLSELKSFIATLDAWLPSDMHALAGDIMGELTQLLTPIIDLGLSYLTLGRAANSLSTGELQRIQLSRTLRTETTGVLYVLDEPSIGLHAANVKGLLTIMRGLVTQGNSLVVVDHNTAIIAAADDILEIGPGSGAQGGQVIAHGPLATITHDSHSLIAPFITGKAQLIVRPQASAAQLAQDPHLSLTVTRRFNLNNVHVAFPLHRLSVVSGFSGAGKSTLIFDALIPAMTATKKEPAPSYVTDVKRHGIRKVTAIDASPVGKNIRSTVATYTDILDQLRRLFASLPEAKKRHFGIGHFSYNVKAGACPTCGGTGMISLDIQYLPDMQQVCPTCHGRRYNPKVLQVKWEGYSIADLLDLDVVQAQTVFSAQPKIRQTLDTLADMGLDYLHLGESTPSLSGGEAQRLKLVAQMGRAQSHTLFVFDEPSVGLHPLDVQVLLQVFQQLLDQGATIIAIEHDLDVLANADYLVDLGPHGGDEGGQIMATGTPKDVAMSGHGETATYLKAHLKQFDILP